MQELLSVFNMDAISLSIAAVVAGGLMFALRLLFVVARGFAQKTPTAIDDKIVDETEKAFREKAKDL